MRLGFIGTGRMGHPMARKLIEAGHEVRAVARSHDKRATARRRRRAGRR